MPETIRCVSIYRVSNSRPVIATVADSSYRQRRGNRMNPESKLGHSAPFGKWVHWVLLGESIPCASIGFALESSTYAGKGFAILLGILLIRLRCLAILV